MNGKAHGQLRRSQVITTFGPGALIDLPNESAIVGGLDTWGSETNLEPIEEPRLASKLTSLTGVHDPRLYAPPSGAGALAGSATGNRRVAVPGVVSWCRNPTPARRDRPARVPAAWCGGPRSIGADSTRGQSWRLDSSVPAPEATWTTSTGTGSCTSRTTNAAGSSGWTSAAPAAIWRSRSCAANVASRAACTRRRTWPSSRSALAAAPDRGWDATPNEPCDLPSRLLIRTASNAWFPQVLSVLSLPDRGTEVDEAVEELWQQLQIVN